jgi:hypothetical protein
VEEQGRGEEKRREGEFKNSGHHKSVFHEALLKRFTIKPGKMKDIIIMSFSDNIACLCVFLKYIVLFVFIVLLVLIVLSILLVLIVLLFLVILCILLILSIPGVLFVLSPLP